MAHDAAFLLFSIKRGAAPARADFLLVPLAAIQPGVLTIQLFGDDDVFEFFEMLY